MPDTRRGFLQAGTGAAAGLAARTAYPQAPPARGGAAHAAEGGGSPADSIPDSQIKVPKIRFGAVEISRLIAAAIRYTATRTTTRSSPVSCATISRRPES
jgi:hypothetical protein